MCVIDIHDYRSLVFDNGFNDIGIFNHIRIYAHKHTYICKCTFVYKYICWIDIIVGIMNISASMSFWPMEYE